MVLLKLAGWGLLFFGGAMVLIFPYNAKNQPDAVAFAGIILGIIFIGIGLFLIKI